MRPRLRSHNLFGAYLAKVLAERGITAVDLCRRTGTKPSTLSHYGTRRAAFAPKPELAYAWAKVLGLGPKQTKDFVLRFQAVYAPIYLQEVLFGKRTEPAVDATPRRAEDTSSRRQVGKRSTVQRKRSG